MSARESNPSLCGTKTNLESEALGVVVIDKKLARLLITPQELIIRIYYLVLKMVNENEKDNEVYAGEAIEIPRQRKSKFMVPKLIISCFLTLYLLTVFLLRQVPVKTTNVAQDYLNILETNLAGNWSHFYSSESFLAGTNYKIIEFIKSKFTEFGLNTVEDRYDVYLSFPEDHDLKLLDQKTSEVLYRAPLQEDEIEEDEGTKGDLVPTFLGYAANGNVTGEYVYANYGTIKDFANLKEAGVNVTGKIAVVRYGEIFRGLKVKFAQENGAIGVLIYTDPGDDHGITPRNGYKQYPHGPARQESSVQRGSAQFLGGIETSPGDPTTPGYPSKEGVSRTDPKDSIGLIPALPISYREVKPILSALNGYGHKKTEWKGGLEGFDYWTGPNPQVSLNLYNKQTYNITPIYNVYGKIEGRKKNEVVLIGNHHDAWIKGGAGDPHSGSATILEIARALGELAKNGYEFQRTIVFASWDAEEYGLIGSTEFGEFQSKILKAEVVAYLNLDASVVGKVLDIDASPVLNSALRKAAKKLSYPEKGVGSLYDHFVKEKGDKIGNLGSGSDYTVFLEHLGIPSVDFGFQPSDKDPIYQYHSNYDSYYWMSNFGDPGFKFHNLMAKYLGLVALDLSQSKLIPFGISDYAEAISSYYDDVKKAIPEEWLDKPVDNEPLLEYLQFDQNTEKNVYEDTKGYYYANGLIPFPHWNYVAERMPCHFKGRINKMSTMGQSGYTLRDVLKQTESDVDQFVEGARQFDATTRDLQLKYDNRDSLSYWERIKIVAQIFGHNKKTFYFERNFLTAHGLHNRSWFKHMVFASGRFTGYAGQTLPGIREAIEDGSFDRLVSWLGKLSKALKRVF